MDFRLEVKKQKIILVQEKGNEKLLLTKKWLLNKINLIWQKIQIKESISSVSFKTEKEVKTVDDNLEFSEEVEFDDGNELNEVLDDDIVLEKE